MHRVEANPVHAFALRFLFFKMEQKKDTKKKENRKETEKEGNNEAGGKSVLQLSAAALNIMVMGVDRGCTFLNYRLRIQPKHVGVT